jgi:hypothetical protein
MPSYEDKAETVALASRVTKGAGLTSGTFPEDPRETENMRKRLAPAPEGPQELQGPSF